MRIDRRNKIISFVAFSVFFNSSFSSIRQPKRRKVLFHHLCKNSWTTESLRVSTLAAAACVWISLRNKLADEEQREVRRSFVQFTSLFAFFSYHGRISLIKFTGTFSRRDYCDTCSFMRNFLCDLRRQHSQKRIREYILRWASLWNTLERAESNTAAEFRSTGNFSGRKELSPHFSSHYIWLIWKSKWQPRRVSMSNSDTPFTPWRFGIMFAPLIWVGLRPLIPAGNARGPLSRPRQVNRLGIRPASQRYIIHGRELMASTPNKRRDTIKILLPDEERGRNLIEKFRVMDEVRKSFCFVKCWRWIFRCAPAPPLRSTEA